MKEIALVEIQNDLSRYLELAENEEIVIINNGQLQKSRQSLREGKGVKLEDLDI
ncbi:hypothetical protein NUACC26_097060 [Scytonema sp. NUACC26]